MGVNCCQPAVWLRAVFRSNSSGVHAPCTVKKKGVNDHVIGSIPSSHCTTRLYSNEFRSGAYRPGAVWAVDILTLYHSRPPERRVGLLFCLLAGEKNCVTVERPERQIHARCLLAMCLRLPTATSELPCRLHLHHHGHRDRRGRLLLIQMQILYGCS